MIAKVILPAVLAMIWSFLSQHKNKREPWIDCLIQAISDGSSGHIIRHPPGLSGSYRPFQAALARGGFCLLFLKDISKKLISYRGDPLPDSLP